MHRCHVITPIAVAGERHEEGAEVELTAAEYLRLRDFGAVELVEEREARANAEKKIAKAREEAEKQARAEQKKAEAQAKREADKARAEAEIEAKKAERERQSASRQS